MTHFIFVFQNVTILRQMLSALSLIFKHSEISSDSFHIANTNRICKCDPLYVTCNGLQENNFQVNQLYDVTWSIVYAFQSYTINKQVKEVHEIIRLLCPLKLFQINIMQHHSLHINFYLHFFLFTLITFHNRSKSLELQTITGKNPYPS